MSLNDLHAVRDLRERQAHLFENVPPASWPRRVLIYSMDPWQLGTFEQFLHLGLVRTGHQPVSLYYDGLLPICAWENAVVPPPPVEKLIDRFTFIYECFGIEARGISGYLDGPQARERAEALVASTGDKSLPTLVYRDIAVGRIARRDLFQYTVGAFDPITPDEFALYRRHLVHAVMSVDLAWSILATEKPDIVVLVNGKSVMYSYLYEVAKVAGVQATTWEEGMYFDTGLVLSNGARAIDFPVEYDIWKQSRGRPLSPKDNAAVDGYFDKWRQQTATAYVYYDKEERDFDHMRRELNIPANTRLVSIFTNIVWDTNALDKDDAFDGMMDWVFATIDLLAGSSDATLIVRAHPGEAKWEFKTRTPVRDLIERRYGKVPDHVRIVDGRSEFSSYEIAKQSDRCAVYTSTLGIELSLMGLQPIVCGLPFYSRKGFTNDVTSREQYEQLMLGQKSPRAADGVLLRRFMHLVLFKLVKRPEFFVGIHQTPQHPIVHIESFEGWPQSMPVFNEIVNDILAGGSFIHPERPWGMARAVQSREIGVTCA